LTGDRKTNYYKNRREGNLNLSFLAGDSAERTSPPFYRKSPLRHFIKSLHSNPLSAIFTLFQLFNKYRTLTIARQNDGYTIVSIHEGCINDSRIPLLFLLRYKYSKGKYLTGYLGLDIINIEKVAQ